MKVTWPKANREFGLLDALGVTGLCGLLVARFIPVARLPFWGCVLRQRTGWPCLGCGLTRVADHVAHFDLGRAWAANPLGTVAALLFALAALYCVLHLTLKLPAPRVELSPKEAWALRAALVVAVVVNYGVVVVRAKFPQLLS
jgi:hypothetical protein